MTYTYNWESVDQLLADGWENLLVEHWVEVAMDRDIIPLAVDWDRYRLFEKTEAFKTLAMRKDGVLVGYSAWFINPHLHYKTTLFALNDVIYLDPAYRRGLAGARLVREAENALAALGAVKAIYHTKLHVQLGKRAGTLGDLLLALGYKHIENTYAKLLRG